jgi:hypothetical protein
MVYLTQRDTMAGDDIVREQVARQSSDVASAAASVGGGEDATAMAEELRRLEADLNDKAAQLESGQIADANALIEEARAAYASARARGQAMGIEVPEVNFPSVSSAASASQAVMVAQQSVGNVVTKVDNEEARRAVSAILDAAYITGAIAYAAENSAPAIATATGFGLSPAVAAVSSLVNGGQTQSSHVEPSLLVTMDKAMHLATSGAAAAMSSPEDVRQLLKGNGDVVGETKGRFAEQLKSMLSNETQQLLQNNPELAALVVGHGRGASASPVIGSTSTGVLMAQLTDGLNGRGAQQQQTAGVNV